MENRRESLRKVLETQGNNPEEIEAILKLTDHNDRSKKIENLKSWFSLVISFIAVAISFFALIITQSCK